jgi:hypothetical protein
MPDPAALAGPLTIQEFYVRVSISLIILLSALFVILSPRFQAREKNWAINIICMILGYWLRR